MPISASVDVLYTASEFFKFLPGLADFGFNLAGKNGQKKRFKSKLAHKCPRHPVVSKVVLIREINYLLILNNEVKQTRNFRIVPVLTFPACF